MKPIYAISCLALLYFLSHPDEKPFLAHDTRMQVLQHPKHTFQFSTGYKQWEQSMILAFNPMNQGRCYSVLPTSNRSQRVMKTIYQHLDLEHYPTPTFDYLTDNLRHTRRY